MFVNLIFMTAIGKPPNGKKTINISLAKLKNIHKSGVKIGKLTCKQWHTLLSNFFDKVMANKPAFDFYGNLNALLIDLTDPQSPYEAGTPARKAAYRMNFLSAFSGYAREKTGIAEITPYTMAVTTLFSASAKVKDLIAKSQSYNNVIETANETLELVSERLPVNLRIAP
ncbi:MAG: hypothetical protein U9R38_07975 [Candidatus Margulisiibacteriota bacterium]|nr:hypothetical protein [Candidatus Margulisiibacteriota bacterium]